MKIKLSFILLMTSFLAFLVKAQEAKSDFKANGKPIITIFSDFHTGFGTVADETGFGLERAYLGYQYAFSPNWSGKVIFDMGSSNLAGSSLERIAYVKNAMLSWEKGDFSLDAGLIGLKQFKVQEKFWGYRYILKSFHDIYGYGTTADAGLSVEYRINDLLSADVTITNGEGYKKLNTDKYFRYGGGLSITPIKELSFRLYYDRHDKDPNNLSHDKSKQITSFFAGYKNEAFSLGAEYVHMYHAQFRDDRNQYGFSAYTTVRLPKDFQLFGRWDYAASNKDYSDLLNTWNPKDEQMLVLGLQYSINKNIKLAPNLRMITPKNGSSLYYATVNLYLSL